jgi:hypothetical protein
MKVIVDIDETVALHLKREAARLGRTTSEVAETAIKLLLALQPVPSDLPPIPVFDGGGTMVDVADRDALYEAMEWR